MHDWLDKVLLHNKAKKAKHNKGFICLFIFSFMLLLYEKVVIGVI